MTTKFKETYEGELAAIAKAMIDYCTTTEPAIVRGKDKAAIITIMGEWLRLNGWEPKAEPDTGLEDDCLHDDYGDRQ